MQLLYICDSFCDLLLINLQFSDIFLIFAGRICFAFKMYSYEETIDDPDVRDVDDSVCTSQASCTGGYPAFLNKYEMF